jgi:hypothetical protein
MERSELVDPALAVPEWRRAARVETPRLARRGCPFGGQLDRDDIADSDLQHPTREGAGNHVRRVARVHFHADFFDMALDGPRSDVDALSDLLGRPAMSDELEDLLLTTREEGSRFVINASLMTLSPHSKR